MNILILGGSGFLGSHLADRLIKERHKVISLDVSKERFRESPSGLDFVEADFGNRGVLESVVSSEDIDIVFHLVSTTLPASSNKDPIFDVQTNLIESIAVLDICVKYKVKKLIFVSSGGTIYGSTTNQVPVKESAEGFPWCSYGIVKATIEKYLALYKRLYDLDYVSLRLANPYGPRQDPLRNLGAVSTFLYKAIKREPIQIWGNGDTVRDYLYVEDFVDVCASVLNSNFIGPINVGSGAGLSLNDLVSAINLLLGYDVEVQYLKGRAIDLPWMVLDNTLASKTFNWTPKTSLDDGLLVTYSWLLSTYSSTK